MTELYKKHRPRSLGDVVGSEGTVAAVRAMLRRGDVPRTILLSGPSGCGKTTVARILRRKLGCAEADFAELNCAQARGVDTVRDIQRLMQLAPAGGTCRIWLLDEVHQLTKEAQHASLKMLEDTPRHVYFVLATTDAQKLLPTIRTRCTELPLQPLTDEQVAELVGGVARKEGIALDGLVLGAIQEEAGGSARRALVLLDKVRTLPPGEQESAVRQGAGQQPPEVVLLCRALVRGEHWRVAAKLLRGIQVDPEQVRWAVLGYARAVLLSKGDKQAYVVIDCFSRPFYDSKEAGLAAACYEATSGG